MHALLHASAFLLLGWAGPPQPRLDITGGPLPHGAVARLGTNRLRSPWAFTALAFTPDGRCLVTSGHPRELWFWDVATGTLVKKAGVKFGAVTGLQFSPDGKVLALATSGGPAFRFSREGKPALRSFGASVHLLDAETCVERKACQHEKSQAVNFCLSPDGKSLVTQPRTGSTELKIWDAEKRTLRKEITGLPQAGALAFLPDGRHFVALWKDARLHLIDAATGASVRCLEQDTPPVKGFLGPGSRIWAVGLASGGKQAIFRPKGDRHYHVVDVTTGKCLRSFEGARGVGIPDLPSSLLLTPDDRYLLAAHSGVIEVWEVSSGKLERVLAQPSPTQSVSLSPDGKYVAARDGRAIQVWDVRTGKHCFGGNQHRSWASRIAFSRDGKLIATAGFSNVYVWEAAGKLRRQAPLPTPTSPRHLRFSPDSASVEWVGRDAARYAWQWQGPKPPTRQALARAELPPSPWSVTADGRWLAYITPENQLRLMCPTGTLPETRLGLAIKHSHQGPEISPDGRWLALPCNRSVVLYGLEGGASRARILTGSSEPTVFYSPCSRFLLLGEEGALRVIEARAGGARLRLLPENNRSPRFAFSADGRLLASSYYPWVVVHDLLTGKELMRRLGGQGMIGGLAFSHDGRRLASSGGDTTVLIWDVPAPPTLARQPGLSDDNALRALGVEDAARARVAMAHLAATPAASVRLIEARRKRPPAGPKQIAQWIADLDAEAYAVREKATEELAEAGSHAEEALREALKKASKEPPALEVKKRAALLLGKLRHGKSARGLRDFRVVELLERMNTREARALLRAMSKEKLRAELLADIKAALYRMEARP